MTTQQVIRGDTPTPEIVDLFLANRIRVETFVDIYESDNVTPWRTRVPITEGSVSVSMGRAERRNVSLTLAGNDGEIEFGPRDGLWYDKIIKPFRGLIADGFTWVTCLGEFMPDMIERPHFPDILRLTGRDFAKKLMRAKFAQTTTFAAGQRIEDVIKAIASAADINKFNLAITNKTLPYPVTFERNTERMKPIIDLADSIAHEVFFDNFGYLVLRPHVDPATAPPTFTFSADPVRGSLVSYTRKTGDTAMFNDVVVYGDGQNNALVFAQAEHNDPDSPTAIDRVGRITKPVASKFVGNNAEALVMAKAYLRVGALEQYDVSIDSLVLPWLEAGDAVDFIATESAPNEPTRFLLTDFSVPLSLGAMNSTAKRVHLVTT